MSLTFYYAPMSTSGITEAVLAELGTPCERVKLDIKAGDTKKPDYLAINPNGRVPTIVHDGTAVWESAAITLYLGEAFGVDAKLYPAAGAKRGEAMRWVVWANVTLAEAASRVMQGADWLAEEKRNAAAAESGKRDVGNALKVLDAALAGKSYLLGEYTIVDTHVHAVAHWLQMLQVDLAPFEHVSAWLKRIDARPSMAKLRAGAA